MALSKSLSEKPAEPPVTKAVAADKKEKPPTKVIVRRLPPNMSEEEFLNQVSPIPEYDYIYSVRGDISLGENAFSRVYINFVLIDDVYEFKDKFDNYVFIDEKGHEYTAVVEFAPFQKIPKLRKKPKPDTKCATIETDQIYLDFVDSLNDTGTGQEEKPEYSFQPTSDSKIEVISTPLIDYLKQRKLEKQKVREEKRDERRRRDLERKRIRDEERRKRLDDKPPPRKDRDSESTTGDIEEQGAIPKASTSREANDTITTKEFTRSTTREDRPSKFREKKYEEKSFVNSKLKKKFDDKKEPRNRRDEFRNKEFKNKSFEHKAPVNTERKEPEPVKPAARKVKKYSERREERKTEAKKAAQNENTENKPDPESKPTEKLPEEPANLPLEATAPTCDLAGNKENKSDYIEEKKTSHREEKPERKAFSRNREGDPRVQRRIRNKDRPTMAIYQPGMLKKKSDPSTSANADDTKDE